MVEFKKIEMIVDQDTAKPLMDINLVLDIEAYQDACAIHGKGIAFAGLVEEMIKELEAKDGN